MKSKKTKKPAAPKKTTAKKPTAKTVKKTTPSVPSPETPVDTDKKKIIEAYATKSGDTGSPEVQIALLSHKIERLVSHLKANPKDNHSRRGLLGMISKRRRLLTYLQRKAEDRYKVIAKKIGLLK